MKTFQRLYWLFVVLLATAGMAHAQTWMSQDIGAVGTSGSASTLPSGGFLVTGGGADIWNTADAFQFVYQTLTGDGEMIVRVASAPTSDATSKAGIMIRSTLNANAINETLVVTRSNGIQFTSRKTTGGTTATKLALAGRSAPQWIKLIRGGTLFSAYSSMDGITWEFLGSDTLAMSSVVLIGMAVTAHNNALSGTAMFDSISVVPGTVTDVNAPQPPTLTLGVRSNSSLALNWSGATDDVGISSYEVDRNGVAAATIPATTYSFTDSGLMPSTTYSYTIRAFDVSGKVSLPNISISGCTDSISNGLLSASQDIGTVGVSGSMSYTGTSGSYTLKASGTDILGTSDAFQFGYQPSSGDTEIVVRVASIQNTNASAKAGAMIRESLNPNASNASIFVTYSAGVVFQSRESTGGTTLSSVAIPGKTAPQWLKLVRQGNAFTGYLSADGVSWQYVGGDTISMAASAYAGLALTSHTNTVLNTATFTNLDITVPVDAAIPSSPTGLNVYASSDVSLSLSWNLANDDIAVAGYDIFQDGVQIGATPLTRFTGTFLTPGTLHNYTVEAFDGVGNLSLPGSISFALAPATLPQPWLHNDLGNVNYAGSAALNSGTFSVSGAGVQISGTQDSFHYVYQPLNGNSTIIARISSIPNPPNTSARAGVMIRGALDAGAPNAMMLVLGGSGANLGYRGVSNGNSSIIAGDKTAKAPYWVKLVRDGSQFAGYQSTNGVNWTLLGSCTVTMGTSGYIGLAVSSYNSTTPALATFDNVQITQDSDGDGLADWWEWNYFHQLGVDPNALAPRNDGLTNLQAFQQGLNPVDYFNGIAPTVTKVSGDAQNGAINTLLAKPLTVRVSGSGGVPLVNAPVTITVPLGAGLLSTPPTLSSSSVFHSDASGLINVYYQEGSNWITSSQIKLQAGKTASTFTATASPQIGHWSFSTVTSGTTSDSSNTGNTAFLIGGVTTGKGYDGSGAVVLNGSTGYVQVQPSPSMALGTGALSITAWVNIPKNLPLNNDTQIYPIVTMGDGTSDAVSLKLRGGGHGLEATIQTPAGLVQIDGTNAIAPDGYWHQVALIYDGTNSVSVGFDGALQAAQTGLQISTVPAPLLWIGHDSAGHFFGTTVDEVELRRDVLAQADVLGRYNVDANKNAIPDRWEWKYFGVGTIAPSALSPSGNGLTNLQCYQAGKSPIDYYNAVAPVVIKIAGDGQTGMPGFPLAQGLTILVSDSTGAPLVNAPVNFTVTSGSGFVALSATSAKASTLSLRTGSDGQATVYYTLGSQFGTNQIQLTAGLGACAFSETAIQGNIPTPWRQVDVGITAFAGTGNYASGIFGISAAGVDIWGTQDGFHYIYQPLNGNKTIIARVASMPVSPDPWTKAGVMIRETLDAGSRNVMLLVSSTNGIDLQWRNQTNISSNSGYKNQGLQAPYWIKLIRSGSTFVGYQSQDGISWELAGMTQVSIANSAYIGLAVTSHNATKPAFATFDSVQITDCSDGSGLPDWWQVQYFYSLGVDPNALAPVGNGLTNRQAYQQGICPIELYPIITKVNGDNQNGIPNNFLAQGLTVSLTNGAGAPLVNTPVSFSVQLGGGVIATSTSGAVNVIASILTGTDGLATVYYKEGASMEKVSQILMTSGSNNCTFNESTLPLVADWNFNEWMGLVTYDYSATGNTMALNGGATWTSGHDGNGAISLDGSTGYLSADPSLSLGISGTTPLTVSTWVQLPQDLALLNENQIYPILMIGDSNSDLFSLAVRGGGHGLEIITTGSTTQNVIDGPVNTATLLNGKWHYIAFSYDANGKVILTMDGCLLATGTGVQLSTITSARAWLGRNSVGNFFRGNIDDTQIRHEAQTLADFLDFYTSFTFNTIQVISGNSFTSTSGQWMIVSGSSALNTDRRGSIDYSFTVPSDGVWGFQINAQPVKAVKGVNVKIPVDVLVDGYCLGRFTIESFNGAPYIISGLIQYLQAGHHTLQIVNWNANGIVNLQINSVRVLESPRGADGSQSDWLTQKLQADNTLTPPTAFTYTSPICIEGQARIAEQTVITSGTTTVNALRGINNQWYANAPLNGNGTPTTVTASFEGGLVSSTTSIIWSDFNVLAFSNTSTVVRKGDSLRLTGYTPNTQASGLVTISVSSGTTVAFSGTTTANNPIICNFANTGTYSVQATRSGTTARSTITVKDASFGDSITAYVNNTRTWLTPAIGTDLALDWDTNLNVNETTTPTITGRSFQVLPITSGSLFAVARLTPGGPILSRGEVDAFLDYNATQTGDCQVIGTNSDGSKIVRSSIAIDGLPPGGYVVIQIFVSGAMFQDGTTKKVLTAADFVNGIAKFDINWDNPHSICHHVYMYDAQGKLVGSMM